MPLSCGTFMFIVLEKELSFCMNVSCGYYAGLPNFKKGMAILILALANYLLDIVSPGGPAKFKAGKKIFCFGVPRSPENAFPSLVPWTCQCAKAPHFLYYVPQNTHSPSSLKKPTPLPVQLLVQISVTSNSTALNSRFYCSFLLRMVTQGVICSSYKNLER